MNTYENYTPKIGAGTQIDHSNLSYLQSDFLIGSQVQIRNSSLKDVKVGDGTQVDQSTITLTFRGDPDHQIYAFPEFNGVSIGKKAVLSDVVFKDLNGLVVIEDGVQLSRFVETRFKSTSNAKDTVQALLYTVLTFGIGPAFINPLFTRYPTDAFVFEKGSVIDGAGQPVCEGPNTYIDFGKNFGTFSASSLTDLRKRCRAL
jgi:hypothetical protein